MHLIEKYSYRTRTEPLTIDDAVEISISGSSFDSGVVEELASGLDKSHNLLGRLIQKLHENHVLSDDDVLDFLHNSFTKVEE